MAIKSSGPIKFSDIKKEFGDSNGSEAGISLGKYRVSESYGEMTNMPLDEGIPQSGAIEMSDFYGKKLNVVINYYSGGTENRPNTGSQRYKQKQKAECVGEFKEPPKTSSGEPLTKGSKIWLHINKTIGSSGVQQQTEKCAFRTGIWESGTDLRIQAGNEAYIAGRGGQGGKGGDGGEENGSKGSNGTSAIGIQYTGGTTIVNGKSQAVAAGGGGGGGGGGAGRQEDRGNDRKAGGGGGGGGAGLPAGQGRDGGDGDGRYSGGSRGSNGSKTSGGNGGQGGDNDGEARGGDGGNGGNRGANGQSGGDGGGDEEGSGGQGGQGGNWLRTGGNSVQIQWQGQKIGGQSSGDGN